MLKKRASILRGELDTIVLKALHKSPDRRYSSAEQFAEDIQRYLSNYPIIAKPDNTWYTKQGVQYIQFDNEIKSALN